MEAPSRPPDLSQKLPPLSQIVASRRHKPQPPPSDPPPATPPLPPPPPPSSLRFHHPTRRILSAHDHALFLASDAYTLVTAFVFALADSVRGKPLSETTAQPAHPTIARVLRILDAAEALVSQHPPLDAGGSRFGNAAFRDFVDGVAAALPRWHAEELDIAGALTGTGREDENGDGTKDDDGQQPDKATVDAAVDELSTYFLHALGSRARLDYGSGHELNFALWLLCLNRLGLLPPAAFGHAAAVAFPRYLRLARAVQAAYYLEPAGSHGVWGLDDFQFLPFLLGAAQLVGHAHLRPRSIHSAAVLEECSAEYAYLEQVRWVNATKTVQGLRWHSPMLDDISAARSWEKVEGGMRKMFVKEVLGKRAVMQHFLFGGLVPAVEGMSEDDEDAAVGEPGGGEHAGHDHEGPAWGDCCGIKVPSSIGAHEEMKKRMGGDGLRRIPFD